MTTVEDCDVEYVQLGCFRDKLKEPRPLPRMLSNERDAHSRVWNGHLIQWLNWDEYIEKLICRCAKRTLQEKYNTFGLQYYGESSRRVARARGRVNRAYMRETGLCIVFKACKTAAILLYRGSINA